MGHAEIVRLAAVALYWKVAWHTSNPDVGMGPSAATLLGGLLKQAGVQLDEAEVLAVYSVICGRP